MVGVRCEVEQKWITKYHPTPYAVDLKCTSSKSRRQHNGVEPGCNRHDLDDKVECNDYTTKREKKVSAAHTASKRNGINLDNVSTYQTDFETLGQWGPMAEFGCPRKSERDLDGKKPCRSSKDNIEGQ